MSRLAERVKPDSLAASDYLGDVGITAALEDGAQQCITLVAAVLQPCFSAYRPEEPAGKRRRLPLYIRGTDIFDAVCQQSSIEPAMDLHQRLESRVRPDLHPLC